MYPESITSDAQARLYVSSAATGEILRIEPCSHGSPVIETFAASGGPVIGAGGLRISSDQSSIWVCSADFSFMNPAAIVGFNLDDGQVIAVHEWPDIGGICNDLNFDPNGNLYATDSLMNRVMRVPAGDLLAASTAETWSQDPAFMVPMGQFGLDGIVHDPLDDALLVTIFFPGTDGSGSKLLRVPIEADGSAGPAVTIDLGGAVVLGADELVADGQGSYLLAETLAPALSRLTIDGGSAKLERLYEDLDSPTAVAPIDHYGWVVQSQLDHFFGQDPSPPTLPFTLVRKQL